MRVVPLRAGPRLRLLAVALCAASGSTCDSEDLAFPTAPTTLTSGIAVYDGPNFTGASAHVDRDVDDLSEYQGPCVYDPPGDEIATFRAWDDCISSIRVAAGVTAVIFVDTGFKGFAVTIDRDVANLGLMVGPCHNGSMNDCVSSIRVRVP